MTYTIRLTIETANEVLYFKIIVHRKFAYFPIEGLRSEIHL